MKLTINPTMPEGVEAGEMKMRVWYRAVTDDPRAVYTRMACGDILYINNIGAVDFTTAAALGCLRFVPVASFTISE